MTPTLIKRSKCSMIKNLAAERFSLTKLDQWKIARKEKEALEVVAEEALAVETAEASEVAAEEALEVVAEVVTKLKFTFEKKPTLTGRFFVL